jgi:protein-disulfide isomerase
VQCKECADYQLETIDQLIADEVRAGDVKLVFHHYSMDEDRQTGVGGIGAVAAGLQDQQWQFIELFFRNQDQIENNIISQEFLDQVANGILNLNVEQWQRDFDEQEVQDILVEDDELGLQRKLPLQPAVVVDGDGGTRELIEKPSIEEIRQAIDEVSG